MNPIPISRRALLLGTALSVQAAKTSTIHAGCLAEGDDPLEQLAKLKQAGFEGFETNYVHLQQHFAKPEAARSRLKKSGLRFIGMRVMLNRYDPQTAIASWPLLTRVADACAALGAERLIAGGAATAHPADTAAKVEALNRIADYCHTAQVGLAYSGDEQLEELFEGTDRNRVHFILRSAAIGLLGKHGKRIDGIQVAADSDWAALKKAIEATQWKGWLIAEDPGSLAAIRQAI